MSYLFVDAADNDTILAQCEWLDDVLPMLQRLQDEQPHREVLIAQFSDWSGELFSTRALVTARVLGGS